MTIYIADHTGTLTADARHVVPVHIGAALVDADVSGPVTDMDNSDSISSQASYADLRLMRYVGATAPRDGPAIAIMQYRRMFFLGEPYPWQRRVKRLWREFHASDTPEGLVPPFRREVYLNYLSHRSRHLTSRILKGADVIANQMVFNDMTVEEQYLQTITDHYVGEEAYVDAWHDMRKAAEGMVGSDAVVHALDCNSGCVLSCFVAPRAEFFRYHDFLFELIDRLSNYREVFRLYGYLAERIQNIYLAARSREGDFRVDAQRLMLFR